MLSPEEAILREPDPLTAGKLLGKPAIFLLFLRTIPGGCTNMLASQGGVEYVN